MARAHPDTSPVADDTFTTLYQTHYASLVRQAALLLGDAVLAEDVVQEVFVRVAARRRGRSEDYGIGYLRRSVVNLTRSSWRHQLVVRRERTRLIASTPLYDRSAAGTFQRLAVVEALQTLPRRQREVVVLRYYEDLSEAETARTLGVSVGTVKTHASRGLAKLRAYLEDDREHA